MDRGIEGRNRIQPTVPMIELVERARRNDDAALSTLAERACTLALRTAYAIVGTRSQAVDIAQSVGVDAIRGLASLRDPNAFDAWVHRITVRHARHAIRRGAIRRRTEVPLALAAGWDKEAASGNHAELVAIRSALAAALTELSPRQRIAIALRYVHDLDDAEIARVMGCREGSVHSLLSRARSKLRASPHVSDLRPATQGAQRE